VLESLTLCHGDRCRDRLPQGGGTDAGENGVGGHEALSEVCILASARRVVYFAINCHKNSYFNVPEIDSSWPIFRTLPPGTTLVISRSDRLI
jgi:hypothetical protein